MTFSSGGFELFSEVTDALEVPQLAALTSWLQGDRGPAQHAHAMASLSCLRSLRCTPGLRSHRVLQFPLVVGAWNLERCYFPDPSAELMKTWDIALLSEMDSGMARTGQVDTTAYLAAKLGMASVYGVEFLELGLGNALERAQCRGEVNGQGLHGNAVMSRTALEQPLLFRLDQGGRWFAAGATEPRIGGRCAVAARVATELGPLWVVSVHLEYSDSAQLRAHTFTSYCVPWRASWGTAPSSWGVTSIPLKSRTRTPMPSPYLLLQRAWVTSVMAVQLMHPPPGPAGPARMHRPGSSIGCLPEVLKLAPAG